MENQQMQMPAEMPPVMPPQNMGGAAADPMALFEQMRQQVSPQDFSNQILAGAAEVDPQTVAKFKQSLQGLNVPVEVLSALNDLVDAILANPSDYTRLRQGFIDAGVPEDFLPEQFDPEFFAALNMAVDQMMATSTGAQAFAKGGIAELKPIAKAIASYGRNGDTILAHINPAEARLLKRRGGSGSINPYTGLLEFGFFQDLFDGVGNVFKGIGDAISGVVNGVVSAVKDFASSTVGKLVTTVALGFFLGPAAVSFLGATAGTMTAAAITGFVGSAGASLLAGNNIGDAIKAGAVGGLTAGAIQGVGSAINPGFSMTGQEPVAYDPATATRAADFAPGNSVADAQSAELLFAPTPTGTAPPLVGTAPSSAVTAPVPLARPVVGNPSYVPPTIGESFTKIGQGLGIGDTPASPAGFKTFTQGVEDLFLPSGGSVPDINAKAAELVRQTPGLPFNEALKQATTALSPSLFRTYAPAVVAGLGATALAGGFTAEPVKPGPVTESNRLSADERMRRDGTERLNYLQNMPGVVYNEKGEPISGQTTLFPTYASSDYANNAKLPFASSGQTKSPFQDMSSMYTPPPNALTNNAGGIYQPYNNSNTYPSFAPPMRIQPFPQPARRYAAQGGIADLAVGGYPRRTGQISGPGTEKSDDIPAMLSDGEFVMTASAVRGAGKGSRREGAKKMYKLMHQLEKNSERG